MPLVPAICTQCGAQIEVDNSYEAGICKHCGTAFITEKAINKYTTNITNNNNFAGANINVVSELEQLVSAAQGFLQLGEYYQAMETYRTVTEKYPQDVRGWLGCISSYSNSAFYKEPIGWDAEWLHKAPFSRWYKNAYLLADEDTKKSLEQSRKKYIDAINKKWEDFRANLSFSNLKNFIGNSTFAETDCAEKLYVSGNRLYYELSRYFYFSSTPAYVRFEITNMDSSGNLSMRVVNAEANTSLFGESGSERKQKKEWVNRITNLHLKISRYDGDELYFDGHGYALQRRR